MSESVPNMNNLYYLKAFLFDSLNVYWGGDSVSEITEEVTKAFKFKLVVTGDEMTLENESGDFVTHDSNSLAFGGTFSWTFVEVLAEP